MGSNDDTNPLSQKHCVPCEGGIPAMSGVEAKKHMNKLHPDWQLIKEDRAIAREFQFINFYDTMAFVNAVSWIAHRENHHPDLEISYQQCVVRYSTHAINGLSQNDFICAARIDTLLT